MYPLTDITIYNLFDPIEVPENEKSVFPHELSFVCELYHENMNGYKPKKTSRICIDIATEEKAKCIRICNSKFILNFHNDSNHIAVS
jgi:hypothetical protein